MLILITAAGFAAGSAGSFRATDPGLRDGAPAAGGPISGLTPQQVAMFNASNDVFQEVDSIDGSMPSEEGKGLGPSFNMNSCSGCHNFPAVGGSSPKVNPQVAVAALDGATNTVPSFITVDGPVREARFKRNADGTPDGGVHDLFVVTGRSDAPSGCKLAQTDFASQVSAGNVSFRIPTPVFGGGLIEAIEDSTILANKASNANLKAALGIAGHENRNGNDGSVTRFGWKAQNKSLLIFAAEAYHVEQGVTNDAFPNPRETEAKCDPKGGYPEDHTDFSAGGPSDVTSFSMFMRMLAPPAPVKSYGNVNHGSINQGHKLFAQTGCALCHTETMTTSAASIDALSNQSANLFSDLLVHKMGAGLADGVSQGNAAGDEFRTAPLWGLGQRLYFLHDGRTADLLQAIQAHSGDGSEANATVDRFNHLSEGDKQDLLNFLRAL
ncbi:MAG TPA: di-heme oxidoredictase family protein [Bryobacteraceae bacterium]